MNAFFELLQAPWTQRLGWTLVHFIWQGTVWAGIFAWVRHALRNAPANRRYAAGCGALLLMLATLTFTFLRQAPEPVVAPTHSTTSQVSASPALLKNAPVDLVLAAAVNHSHQRSGILVTIRQLPGSLTKYMPWFVAVWFAGVAVLSLRLFTGWLKILSLRSRRNQPAEACWLEKLQELKRRLGISRAVRLLTSVAVEVPTAIGWLCPVILLPASSLLGLNPAQVESILAHELAHIRRHDYLVNLLQCLAETLLFYHPAVWWVSKCIRAERENCCDDLAVHVCGDALSYAKALATLEELRCSPGALALAASGKPLLQRIRRLVMPNAQPAKRKWTPSSAGSLGLILIMAALFALPHAHSQKKEIVEAVRTNPAPSVTTTNTNIRSQQEVMRILNETVLDQVSFDDVPLSEVLYQLQKELKRRHPNGPEIKFRFGKITVPQPADLRSTPIRIQPALRNVSISQLLDVLVKVTDKPLRYSIGDAGVIFYWGNPETEPLVSRSFRFDTSNFIRIQKEKDKNLPANAAAKNHQEHILPDLMDLLKREYQVDLSAPGRQLFVSDGKGMAIIRATSAEMERVEKCMAQLDQRATASTTAREKIVQKLQAIKINGLRFENAPLLEVVKQLRTLSKDRDPEHRGVNFMITKKLPLENETEVEDSITIGPLPDMNMYALLDAIVRGSASPLQFKVEDYCVIFLSSNTVPLLRIRSFRFDANTFLAAVLPGTNPQAAAPGNKKIEEAFANLLKKEYGLDLGAPGKQVIYRPGSLTVRATEDDLTVIETFIEKIDQKPSPASGEFKKGNQYIAPQSTNKVKVERKIENSPTTNAAPALYTRTFKIDRATLSSELINRGNPSWSRNDDGSTPDALEVVRRALLDNGFDANAPGRNLFFNDRLQMLMIRGTLQELDKIEKFVQLYNQARPQVTIEVKIVEVVDQKDKPFRLEELLPGQSFYHVTNANRFETSNVRIYRMGKITVEETLPTNAVLPTLPPSSLAILNDGQFRWVIRELEQRTGVDLLSAPRVTTLSSRQTQIKIVDVKTFPTDFNGTANAPTEQVELGPVVDVVPFVSEDKLTISLSVIARVKEFLGYDLSYSESPRRAQTPPTPSFRRREAKAVANVYDGQTLVLDAGVIAVQQVLKDKVPMLADVPFIGNLFQSEKKQIVNKRLLFFITPTIIDPAGNRIHNEEREEIPPQPAK